MIMIIKSLVHEHRLADLCYLLSVLVGELCRCILRVVIYAAWSEEVTVNDIFPDRVQYAQLALIHTVTCSALIA